MKVRGHAHRKRSHTHVRAHAHIGTPKKVFSYFIFTATLFLEFWKRHRASYVCEWKVSDWNEEEVGLNKTTTPHFYLIVIHSSSPFPAFCNTRSSCTVLGGTDSADCEQPKLCTQAVQALVSPKHFGAGLRHTDGG